MPTNTDALAKVLCEARHPHGTTEMPMFNAVFCTGCLSLANALRDKVIVPGPPEAESPRTERMDIHVELDRRYPLIEDFRRFTKTVSVREWIGSLTDEQIRDFVPTGYEIGWRAALHRLAEEQK